MTCRPTAPCRGSGQLSLHVRRKPGDVGGDSLAHERPDFTRGASRKQSRQLMLLVASPVLNLLTLMTLVVSFAFATDFDSGASTNLVESGKRGNYGYREG